MDKATPYAERCVGINEARDELASIVQDVLKKKIDVLIGRNQESARCAFVSATNFNKYRGSYTDGVDQIDLDDLRKQWALKRKVVEFTGRCLEIVRRGQTVMYLVPTEAAYKTIEPLREVVKSQLDTEYVEQVMQRMNRAEIERLDVKFSQMRADISDIADGLPTREEWLQFQRTQERIAGTLRVLINELRNSRGEPPLPPE